MKGIEKSRMSRAMHEIEIKSGLRDRSTQGVEESMRMKEDWKRR